MGMNLQCVLYLQDKGYLTKSKRRLLDIGPQNIYFASTNQIYKFVQNQGGATVPESMLDSEAERITYFSTPREGERTALLSELTDLTNIDYHSFDVCPALKTEILDLNFEDLPIRHVNSFDVVLNFGTTEHVFNQWNSFKIIHEATAIGGIMYHQLPGSGYLDHGYFCYTPVFFEDLAKANGYVIEDIFFTAAGLNDVNDLKIDVRDELKLTSANSKQVGTQDARIPCYNINVVLKKIHDTEFRCALELATSHSAPNDKITERYAAEKFSTSNRSMAGQARTAMGEISGREIAKELFRRIGRRLMHKRR